MNPVVILATLGIAYLFSSSKKGTTSSSGTNKDLPKDLPSVDDKDDSKDPVKDPDKDKEKEDEINIPDAEPTEPSDADKINESKEPEVDSDPNKQIPDQQGGNNIDVIMDKYYSKWYQVPGEKPALADPNSLWISDTCKSWAVGKYFIVDKDHHIAAYLPEKYVDDNKPNSNLEINPVTWWENSTMRDISPDPIYEPEFIVDVPPRSWAMNLIRLHSKCNINFPRRKNFKTYQEYNAVRKQFATTPMGQLWEYLTVQVSDVMFDAWRVAYPTKAEQEIIKYWALSAIMNNPKMTIGNQTDWAYAKYTLGDKNAPKKIGPKDTKYKKLWTNLNVEIKNYLGLIKQYGNQ